MVAHRVGRGLAVYAAAVAASAYLGVAGLALGFLPGTDELRPQLPFHSTLLGAAALLGVVAVPTTLTAVRAWRHDPRASRTSVRAGVLLVGWIVVEVLVVRELSPLQPLCLLLGVGLAGWGWSGRRTSGGDDLRSDRDDRTDLRSPPGAVRPPGGSSAR